jgi:hypothetical protein
MNLNCTSIDGERSTGSSRKISPMKPEKYPIGTSAVSMLPQPCGDRPIDPATSSPVAGGRLMRPCGLARD